MGRRAARTVAFQSLFEIEARPSSLLVESLAARIGAAVEESGRPLGESMEQFAEVLVRGTLEHREAIDAEIARVAPAFPIDQMALTDRVVLELAVYELRYQHDAPVSVVINEAVELAKTYGSETSGRFVNGVLGTIAGSLTNPPAQETPSPTHQDTV